MDLTDVLGGLMKQYGGGEQQQQGGVDADQGFDQLAGMLPQGALGDGLAEAFRSKETPPFAQMLGGLFGQSGGSTQTSVVKPRTEIGPDLSRFANVKHFCAWLGLRPATKIGHAPTPPPSTPAPLPWAYY